MRLRLELERVRGGASSDELSPISVARALLLVSNEQPPLTHARASAVTKADLVVSTSLQRR